MRWLPLVVAVVLLFVVMALDLRRWVRRTLLAAIIFVVPSVFYRADIDRWGFEHTASRVETVDAGNEFTVRGAAFFRRRLALADTDLPADQKDRDRARAALEELVAGRSVNMTFRSHDRNEPEPWRVVVRVGQTDVSRLMTERNHLVGTGPLAAANKTGTTPPSMPAAAERVPGTTQAVRPPEATPSPLAATPAPSGGGRSLVIRYVLWVVFGWLGATSVGRLVNRKPAALPILLVFVGFCGYETYQSVREGVSAIPPLVGLGVMFLLGGPFAKSQRWQEEQRRRQP